MTKFLLRDQEYKATKVNYNRTMSFSSRGFYEKGLLRIEPHQDVSIFVKSFLTNNEVEIIVKKFDARGNLVSEFIGIVPRQELTVLIGLDN